MTSLTPDSANQRYLAAVRATAATDLGGDLAQGTTVVGSLDREGSTAAVAYPLGDRTIIWCAPELKPRVTSLSDHTPLSLDQFVVEATKLGGTFAGAGHQRVLDGPPAIEATDSKELSLLDRTNPDDRSLIAAFANACSDDDLDEAELDLDDLDPAILVHRAEDGSITSYASARPWSFDPDFDDIAVITHPSHRGRGLGATVVAALAASQQGRGRQMFYNCDADNTGSNRLAEAVGFTLVTTIAAVSFEI